MRPKTARRFLVRNAWRLAKHNSGTQEMKPSTAKRVKEATATLVREDDKSS